MATEPMRLALLTAGYADGMFRSLGNRFSLLVSGGQRAPLVGRVSMDHAVIDVTDIPGVEPGDEVVILGKQGSETISAYDHADAADTIPWEVFTRIAARVRRIAVLNKLQNRASFMPLRFATSTYAMNFLLTPQQFLLIHILSGSPKLLARCPCFRARRQSRGALHSRNHRLGSHAGVQQHVVKPA